MIIGHKENRNKLNNLITNNEVAHSYIFSGIDGIGKRLVAYEFAKNILCGSDEIQKSAFDNENHTDFVLIEPDEKGTIKIETIRKMINDINIKPITSNYKVYIIDESDTITPQAQNALLKTLEEPPKYAVILLITSKYYSLLSTIRSRSQKIDFTKLENDDIIEYMSNNNIQIDIEQKLLLNLIDGSIGNIEKAIENVEVIKSMIDFVNQMENLDVIQINKFSQELAKYKDKILILLDYLQTIIFFQSDVSYITEYVKIIEEAKKNVLGNINFEIAMDKMLLNIWEVRNG